MADTRAKYYPLGGGLDVVTPPISISPGAALVMQNYEPWFNGGYRRINGYERFDGRPAPSEQSFTGFQVSSVAALTLGAVVIGVTSGATAVVCGIWDDDGTYGADSIGVTKVVGTFLNGESVNAGAFTVLSLPSFQYAPNSDLEDLWLLQAQNLYRADIGVVPGSGDVRGAWQRKATQYAVRDNLLATAAVLHKASTSGWTTTGITMTQYLYFGTGGGGTAQPLPTEGTVINGQTSGATATVHRRISHGGATATNDEYGYLVLRSVTGTFTNGENLRVGATKFAVATSGSTRFAFPPGGVYRFHNNNFYGGSATYRTYGVNAVGPAFEIDENDFVSPILLPLSPVTGQPVANAPFEIEEHLNYLFLAFPGGSIVQTVVGEPLVINGFLGAAEFGLGSEITGMNSVTGGALIIHTETDARGLFGTGPSDWALRIVGDRAGGKLFAANKIDTVYSLNSLGITSLSRTQAFGDFVTATVSKRIQPLLAAVKQGFTTSTVNRASGQYRLYFDDGVGIVMYVPDAGSSELANRSSVQFGVLKYPITFKKVYNTEDTEGVEKTYVCSSGGYVYKDQVGNTFDGADIEASIRLAFAHLGSPAYRKFFRRLVLEVEATKATPLRFLHDLSYGSSDYPSGQSDVTVTAGGAAWDIANWNEFEWDGDIVSSARVGLGGSGENISFVIYGKTAYAPPYVLQGVTVHYDIRRLQR